MTTPNTRTILVTVSPDLLRNQEQFVDNLLPTVAQELGQAGWLAGGGILFREDNDLSGDGETDFVVDTSVQDPVIGSNGGGVMVAPGVADDLAVIQQALRELPSQEWTTMIEQGGIYFRALREQDYLLNTDGTLRQLNGE